jgi:DNA modification methylase
MPRSPTPAQSSLVGEEDRFLKTGTRSNETRSFKILNIKLDKQLPPAELAAFRELGAQFSHEDLFFELSGNSIVLHLRALDLDKFRATSETIAAKYGLSASKENNLRLIVSRIEDIGSYGFKGHTRLFVDYNKERKVRNRKYKERQRGAYFYALNNGFSESNSIVPTEYLNKIICEDAGAFLKKLPDNCVDLVLTSPPYNFGLKYESHKDAVGWDKYFEKLFSVFEECIRVSKFGGRIAVNVQPLFSDYIPIHHIISNFFIQKKLIWKGEVLWEKHNYNCKYTAWGSWKSPSNPYLKYTWEFLEVFCKGSLKHSSQGRADISADEFKKWVYAKWEIPPETGMKKWGHPAMFPEELVRRSLKLFSFEGDTVLDPFNGVGTTTKVAKELGRNFVGIDHSPEYCEKAESRLRKVGEQGRLNVT